MTPDPIDHAAQARALVAAQYTASFKFLATIAAVMNRVQDLETALYAMFDITDIDLATGVNLDVLGDIVGISRYIEEGVSIPFFGFADTPAAMVFGEEGLASVGGRFRDEDEPYTATSVLGDPEFRLLIRAKIIKNHAIGTNEDIITGLNFIFSGSLNVVSDTGGMKVDVGIGRPITSIEQILIRQLDLLPRPNGVKIGAVVSFESGNFFGFEDQPNAKGFDVGIFAEEF